MNPKLAGLRTTPSPLNGERVGVRGENGAHRELCWNLTPELGREDAFCRLKSGKNFCIRNSKFVEIRHFDQRGTDALLEMRTPFCPLTPHPGPLPVEGRGRSSRSTSATFPL
jgi:hypothetical protein